MTSLQLPALGPENRAFWTSGSKGCLEICRCQTCHRYIHPPMPMCPTCSSMDVVPQSVTGAATVVSYSVNHQPWMSGQETPFVLAVVELVEQPGLWLITNIVNCDVQDVKIGMTVRVRFLHEDDVWIPVFEPAGAV